MASEGLSRPSTEQLSQGLDRASYNVYHNPNRHLVAPLQPTSSVEQSQTSAHSLEDGTLGNGRSRLRRISKKLSENVKTTADVVLHPTHHTKEKSIDPTTVPVLAPPPPEDDENERLFHDAPEQKGPSFKEVVKHPVSTAQSALHGASGAKFAESMDNQVIAHGARVRLLRAYDNLVNAKSDRDRNQAADSLEQLKKARQDAFVRWTLDRHVLTVRRVPPHTTSWPNLGDFRAQGENGRKRLQWVDYGHHLLRYHLEHYGDQYIDQNPNLPTPSEEAFNTSAERLIMTSTPYQILLMKIRHIYRWDNPTETAKYLAAYTFLWTINYLSGAAILALIWTVVKRRLYPPTLEDIRGEIKRSEDVEMTAMNITQLIEQHGSHGWTDALRQDLGPWLLLQLEDLANVLEIWRNFYEWREPTRTKITLVLLSIFWLAITVIPLEIIIKTTQFNFGVMFFGLFPLATRYPQYRLLASPMKWLFWRVPTDAEWAIARLQVEARYRTAAMQKAGLESSQDYKKAGNDSNADADMKYVANLGRYHCTTGNHHGELCVSSEGVRFISAIRKNVLWEMRFDALRLLQKVGTGEGLLFVSTEGDESRVSGLEQRNEVFTQIVGYSGLRWQVSG
ncbi:MAG: hypothetical protein LQ349_004649 [Xanthoria aureola]|nr:MAG: hypothetical protein LQ349_004649 [Xanthoria aureola]